MDRYSLLIRGMGREQDKKRAGRFPFHADFDCA
jgi:hypothetical protein